MATPSLKMFAADADCVGVKKTDLYRIDPLLLVEEEGFNLRDYDDPEVQEHIESFANSYATGQEVPDILVRVDSEGRIIVVEGHCRRRGALLAIERGHDLPFIGARQFRGNDSERVQVMLRSAQGLQLKPLGIAMGVLRLHRMHHTNTEIAALLGKMTPARVEQLLLLAQADHDVHHLVRQGLVSADVAIEAVRAYREKAGEHLKARLEALATKGKTRVTRSSLRGNVLAPKVARKVATEVVEVFAAAPDELREHLSEMAVLDEEELDGKEIVVDAALMVRLFRAASAAAVTEGAPEPESETA